jgi:hypothetical protein
MGESAGGGLAAALALYARDRRHGAPWLVAAGFVAAQAIVMWFAPDLPFVRSAFAAYARLPEAITLGLALIAGAAAGRLGWTAIPRRRSSPPGAMPQAA